MNSSPAPRKPTPPKRHTYSLRTVRFHVAEPVTRHIQTRDDLRAVLGPLFDNLDGDREHFLVLALNARGRVIGYQAVATGTATACLVHPREVFRVAVALGAASIMVAHNHPSGETAPSREDHLLTERLVTGGALLGIPVLDAVVWTPGGIETTMPGSE
jgi:DNA repair protein RadC